MHALPPDYYRSEDEDLAHDSDYGITQPYHPAIPTVDADRDCSTTETDYSWDPPTPTIPCNQNAAATVSAGANEPEELEEEETEMARDVESGTELDLAEILGFSPPDMRTPPWLRAEGAGMSPISPWRQTCDISPSRRPPPSRRGPQRHQPQAAAHSSTPEFPPHASTPPQAHREPLATLYERDPYAEDSSEEHVGIRVHVEAETREIGCNTEGPWRQEYPPTVDVGCQTSALYATDPFPDWLDGTTVEDELRCGREGRLRDYMARFRYSAVAHQADHQRAFVGGPMILCSTAEDLESPLSGRVVAVKRPRLERRTKADAKDKIKSYFEPGSILDSQIDSQVWLEGTLHARTFTASPEASRKPSTPNRPQNSRLPVSPFTLHVPDGQTPRRFSEQHPLSKLTPKFDCLSVPPGREFSYEDLDWLTEYYLRLNAGLTEHMISLHVRLHKAEDKVAALETYIEKNL